MKKGIIILGSSNSNGETRLMVDYLSHKTQFPIIDLRSKNIAHYDYEYKNQEDDFIPLIKDIVENYQLIVFATPVYWYTMSGIMKVFFDRISDLLKIEKDTGRKMRGLEMAIASCGSDRILKDGFHMPFKETANYLGIKYLADVHCWTEEDQIPVTVVTSLDEFIEKISRQPG
jgi:multimeric flavodoxin WrbA